MSSPCSDEEEFINVDKPFEPIEIDIPSYIDTEFYKQKVSSLETEISFLKQQLLEQSVLLEDKEQLDELKTRETEDKEKILLISEELKMSEKECLDVRKELATTKEKLSLIETELKASQDLSEAASKYNDKYPNINEIVINDELILFVADSKSKIELLRAKKEISIEYKLEQFLENGSYETDLFYKETVDELEVYKFKHHDIDKNITTNNYIYNIAAAMEYDKHSPMYRSFLKRANPQDLRILLLIKSYTQLEINYILENYSIEEIPNYYKLKIAIALINYYDSERAFQILLQLEKEKYELNKVYAYMCSIYENKDEIKKIIEYNIKLYKTDKNYYKYRIKDIINCLIIEKEYSEAIKWCKEYKDMDEYVISKAVICCKELNDFSFLMK